MTWDLPHSLFVYMFVLLIDKNSVMLIERSLISSTSAIMYASYCTQIEKHHDYIHHKNYWHKLHLFIFASHIFLSLKFQVTVKVFLMLFIFFKENYICFGPTLYTWMNKHVHELETSCFRFLCHDAPHMHMIQNNISNGS
jgi:hypothetical protein